MPHLPREDFDAEHYLRENADVRDAIARGEFDDPYDHYALFGSAERRSARKHARSRRRRTPPPPAGRTWSPAAPPAPACPICRAFGPIPALLQDGAHILHRCPTCRSCFYADRTMPDYEREEQTGFYQQLYLEQNGSIHHMLGTLFMVDTAGVDSLLDVGCGFGFTVDLAAKTFGWRAVGLDPSHYAREGARLLGADIRKEYLTETTELGQPFGLVVASEVIEHVPDPDAFLLILRRWLQPGRTLVLTTPNADSIAPGAGEAELVSILAVGTHLFLFSAASLELALSRAGFAHIEVEARGNTLVALASDAPITRPPDAATRHIHAYQDYLLHLVATAPPATPLWNGAAGRLLQLRAESAPPDELHTLFARVAEAWRDAYGIDLVRLRLPAPCAEDEFLAAERELEAGKRLMWRLGARQPINLATVLFCRALLESRRPGRLSEDVLRWARPAYLQAVDTARALSAGTMIDLDLRQTAWRARLMIVDSLTELAPEVEGELLLGLVSPPPGALAQRIALPQAVVVARIAPWFTRMVQASRFEEASRLQSNLADLDLVVRATEPRPETMFYTLFALGVFRLVHLGQRADAHAAFTRLQQEAAARPGPQGDAFQRVALEHAAMAAA